MTAPSDANRRAHPAAARHAERRASHDAANVKKGGAAVIGLVLVTHGDLATAFLAAMQHIVGPQSAAAAVCIGPDDDVAARRAEILDALDRVDGGKGAVVMTDMFGGTPSNLALSALGRDGVEVIAGVNLPMLIKFASVRGSESLDEAVRAVQEAGRKYINVASSFLSGSPDSPDSPDSNAR